MTTKKRIDSDVTIETQDLIEAGTPSMQQLVRSLARDYRRNMPEMFAAVSQLYAEYWGDFFHFAIFERPDENRAEALERTHRRYLEDIDARRAQNIIDIACGRGGFTRLLAEATAGQVLGIDISPAQLVRARRHRAPNLEFEQRDVMEVDALQRRFDAAVYLDAACYLPDKRVGVRKIGQVLEPGARLLLVDWCRRERVSDLEAELMLLPFMRFWAVPGVETASSWSTHLSAAGFRLLRTEDLSDKVRPNWELAYAQALRASRELSMLDAARFAFSGLRAGPHALRLMKEQFHAALYIKAGFDAGVLRYVYFLAQKRPDSG
jgi:SAM-dependent methyltransferase